MTQLKQVSPPSEEETDTIKLTSVDAIRVGEFMNIVERIRSALSTSPHSIILGVVRGKPTAVAHFNKFTVVMRE